MVNVRIDTEELQTKLNSLAGALSGKEMGRSIALGINKTLRQARTQSDREIRKVYNLRQSFVLHYIKIKNASNGNFVGTVSYPTSPVPISEYLRTRQEAKGVSVEIMKGKSLLLRGAFLFVSRFNSAASGSIFSVMSRSFIDGPHSYQGAAGFRFRHHRIFKGGSDLHIGAMFSASPFSALMQKTVEKNVSLYVETKLQENIFEILDKNAAGLIRQSNNKGKWVGR